MSMANTLTLPYHSISSNTSSPGVNHSGCRSPLTPGRARSKRWRRTSTVAVVVASLLFCTTAWLSLVFSATTVRFWNQFKHWDNLRSFHHSEQIARSRYIPPPRNLSEWERKEELSLKHLVFGIAGSSHLWKQRKEFVRLWWRPKDMFGHVWFDEKVVVVDGDDLLPPVMVSEDISRFHYTNPIGHPSGLRISRIISESFRLGSPNVRWFVLGDDDTIFNADNLVAVLSKYDPSEMLYIGGPSESHSANTYFSHSMAFGGGGIVISHPLAKALSEMQDECIERYPNFYGSDDRLHACITEIGVPLTREHGFHQWDIRGNAHGLLSSHPIAPFVSIHHIEAVDPFYPGLNSLDSLKLFTEAMKVEPMSFLQRSICYDHGRGLTFSVSLGYVIQVFPNIVLPRELERSEKTYSAWNKISRQSEFEFDTRDVYKSFCKKPILFFLKDLKRKGNTTVGMYVREGRDDFKRRFFCFPYSPPLPRVKNIKVFGRPLRKNWHLVPRRLCCTKNQPSDQHIMLTVGECDKGSVSSIVTDFA